MTQINRRFESVGSHQIEDTIKHKIYDNIDDIEKAMNELHNENEQLREELDIPTDPHVLVGRKELNELNHQLAMINRELLEENKQFKDRIDTQSILLRNADSHNELLHQENKKLKHDINILTDQYNDCLKKRTI